MSAPDASRLREVLVEAGEDDPGPNVTIERLAGGASRESWVVAGRWVLKRDHPSESAPPASAAKEHAALIAAAAAGVPVPRPVACEPAGGRFGTAGFLAELLPGTSSPRRLLALDDHDRSALAADLGRALAALSGADAARVVDVPERGPVEAALADLARELDDVASDRPVLALAWRWLDRHRPEERPPVLVHGDFRVGNFLVDSGRLRGLIDWEFCRSGDPAEDLGFFCLRPWRFGADDRRAGGLTSLDTVLEAHAGDVPAERVRYWEIVGQLRWGLYCLRQAEDYAHGRHGHLERGVVGRRIAEVESDLLDLIEEAAGA